MNSRNTLPAFGLILGYVAGGLYIAALCFVYLDFSRDDDVFAVVALAISIVSMLMGFMSIGFLQSEGFILPIFLVYAWFVFLAYFPFGLYLGCKAMANLGVISPG